MGDDRGLAVAVAAFERVDRAEALFEGRQGGRVVFDLVGQPADLRRDVLQLRLEAGQPLGERIEPRVEAGQAARLADRDRRRVARSGAVGGQRVADRGRSPGDRLAMLGGRQARPDPLRLARPKVRRRDLGRLVLEQVDAASQLARIDRQLGQGRPVRAPALDRPARGVAGLAEPAERIEQVALPALVEEALLLVLAVDLDERSDLVGEPRRRRGEIVDAGRGAPAGAHLADGDERLGQAVEERLHAGRLGAVADEPGVGPGAADEPQARR